MKDSIGTDEGFDRDRNVSNAEAEPYSSIQAGAALEAGREMPPVLAEEYEATPLFSP
jgi:hypothetical protein